jgi:hypothetical protein
MTRSCATRSRQSSCSIAFRSDRHCSLDDAMQTVAYAVGPGASLFTLQQVNSALEVMVPQVQSARATWETNMASCAGVAN